MILFIIKSAITLALLYSCFFVLLSKETFHRFNRIMLIGIMIAAFVVPMLHITTEHPTIINEEVQLMENMTDRGIVFIYEDEATEPQPQFNWVQVIKWVYLAGVAVMLIITLIQVFNLVRLMRGGIHQKDEQGNTIILINGEIPPFSIFHFIVMSVKDYESGRQYILTHEQEHIRLGHSYDLLLMQVLKTIQWFNPFVWFISRDLKTIHEYEADQAVINQGIDAKQYQLFLVKKVVGNRLQPFTNNLNHGSIKKRIAMMYQKKSNRWLMLKALFAIPVIALTVGAFATPAAIKPVEELVQTIEEETSPSFVLQDEREILANEVSNEPSNLLAPETGKGSEEVSDIKPGQVLTGQVTDEKGEPLQTATVFEQDEQFRIYAKAVTDVNGNFAIKIVNPEHNIRVAYTGMKVFMTKAANMPKTVVLPEAVYIQDVVVSGVAQSAGSPLIVVDGKTVFVNAHNLNTNNATEELLSNQIGIKQSDIQSVTVLKDGAATAVYGAAGKNGVIEIKTNRADAQTDTLVASVRTMLKERDLAIKSNNNDLPLDSMINKLPGLEKQPDGSFTVNGKKVKRILVDGEEVNLEDLVK